MINLCLVVIATQFSETKKREMERMRLERARFQSSSTLASSTNNSEPTSCYAEIVKYVAHLWRKSKRKLIKKIKLLQYRRDQRREQKITMGETLRLNYTKRHHPCCPRLKQAVSKLKYTYAWRSKLVRVFLAVFVVRCISAAFSSRYISSNNSRACQVHK